MPVDTVGTRRSVPLVAAVLTAALGVVNIVSGLTPEDRDRLAALRGVVPLTVSDAASAGTVVAGILLIVLAHALRRRKRRAWRAAVVLLLASTCLHVVKGLDVEEATVTLLLAVVLIALREEFFAAGDPRTRWQAPAALLALFATSCALGVALLAAQSESIVGSPGIGPRLQEVVEGLSGVSGPLTFTKEGNADLVFVVLLGLGLATVLIPAYLLLRPPEPSATLSPDDEAAVRRLLDRHGERDSLAYFALRPDKAVIFSPSGKAAVSYRVVSGVMLASGDPLGDPEAWPGAIAAFVEAAGRHAWVPAVIGCSELGAEVWAREAQLRALELGDEAIVPVTQFTLDGRAMRNVRQTVNRVARLGYKADICRTADLTADEVAHIQEQAAAWRDTDVERGFSMALGRFGDQRDRDCLIVTATLDERLCAVLHFVPWGRAGLSLDLMRRDHAADSGVNELMIVHLLESAGSLGVDRVSFNFAVFRSSLERGARIGAGPIIRAWRSVLLFASRWFQIESLYRFNAKFRPEWEPRFVCYPAGRDLPRVSLAALLAEAFVVHPRLRVRALARRLRPGDA